MSKAGEFAQFLLPFVTHVQAFFHNSSQHKALQATDSFRLDYLTATSPLVQITHCIHVHVKLHYIGCKIGIALHLRPSHPAEIQPGPTSLPP
jgi:hypothetical protein